MGDVVNLRRARKARNRADAAVQAAEQRARFGRSPSNKRLDRALEEKRVRNLDSHRREPER